MRFDEASVGGPHDLLKLPELGEEARKLVVDLRRVRGHCGKLAKSKYTKGAGTYVWDESWSRHTTVSSLERLACYMSLPAAHTPTQEA